MAAVFPTEASAPPVFPSAALAPPPPPNPNRALAEDLVDMALELAPGGQEDMTRRRALVDVMMDRVNALVDSGNMPSGNTLLDPAQMETLRDEGEAAFRPLMSLGAGAVLDKALSMALHQNIPFKELMEFLKMLLLGGPDIDVTGKRRTGGGESDQFGGRQVMNIHMMSLSDMKYPKRQDT